jgi:hypothetical protein
VLDPFTTGRNSITKESHIDQKRSASRHGGGKRGETWTASTR